MNRYKHLWLLLAVAILAIDTSCTRNGAPQKRSTSKTKVDHLIIKEVFYAGHYWRRDDGDPSWRPTNSMYSEDQYIIIYNPTDEVKYLDGLALCAHAIDPTNRIEFAPQDNFVNRYYGASSLSYFPGSGQEHPVRPKQSIVVAKYAIDHKANFIKEIEDAAKEEGEEKPNISEYMGIEAWLDLSKADYEWTNAKYSTSSKNNPNIPDLEPILVDTDKKGKLVAYYDFQNVSERNGIALIRLPWTPEDFKANYKDTKGKKGYLHYITVTSSAFADFYAIEIPFDHVIDCMTVCPKSRFQMRPSKLDRGYNAVTDVPFADVKKSDYPKYSGIALTRRWDGKKFVDDDNSSSDFEVKVASLSRKDDKGNIIK